jgi:hypothetical protein
VAFLEALAEATGDRAIRHAARVIAAPPSPGRHEINDDDVLAEIRALMAGGIDKPRAVAVVARNVGAGASTVHRWNRKLRQKQLDTIGFCPGASLSSLAHGNETHPHSYPTEAAGARSSAGSQDNHSGPAQSCARAADRPRAQRRR